MASPQSLSRPDSAPILERLSRARAAGDELFACIEPETIFDRPIPERHRLIFYLGHLEAFDWNLLREHLLGLPSFRPAWDRLFAFGIDPVDGGLPQDQASDWPHPEQVLEYSEQARSRLDRALASRPPEPGSQAERLLEVAVEHRLMHLETLAYLLHELPYDRKHDPAGPPRDRAPAGPQAAAHLEVMISVPAGTATLGRARSDPGFGWDNEYEAVPVQVAAFSADRTKVTNRAFLGFVEAGGYQRSEFWRPQDWAWLQGRGARHPHFWRRDAAGAWLWRGMFSESPLPLDHPVFVSYAEALAFSQWVGKALPTEAQWHRMAYGERGGAERAYPWGDEPPSAIHGNFDGRAWDPTPVDAHPAGDSAWGITGLLGNAWEWTSSPFAPFPGFEPFSFYPGYSANFFDGKHMVLKGGSARTDAALLRRSFRNWFQPHYPYLFAGFRCVSA